MRFLGYVRASTAEQEITLRSQEVELRAWATAFGHDIEIRVESGVSGGMAPEERPVLGAALAQLDAGDFAGLVAVKIDRISRSTRDLIDLVARAEKRGWALVSKNESLDTTTAIGRFVVTLFGALSQMEREVIGERTSAALGQLKRERKPFSSNTPWGWKREGEALVEDDVEQDIARRIERLAIDLSLPCVASLLNDENHVHTRTGKPWTAVSVRSVLRSIERSEAC